MKSLGKLLATFFLATSLESFGGEENIPRMDLLGKLEKEPYFLGVNDCSNKAARYARAVPKRYFPLVHVIRFKDSKMGHALVSVFVNDQIIYIDPSRKLAGRDIKAIYGKDFKPLRILDTRWLKGKEWDDLTSSEIYQKYLKLIGRTLE